MRERFEVLPGVAAVGNDRVVKTQIVTASGQAHVLAYVMRQTGAGWHVVDVLAGEVLPSRAIEIAKDGTIAQVAAAAPPGLPDGQVTDVAGRWLLPGLISCHTHLSVVFPFSDTDEAENPALTAYRSAARASAALTAGITTIRCVHEQNRADLLDGETGARSRRPQQRHVAGPLGAETEVVAGEQPADPAAVVG